MFKQLHCTLIFLLVANSFLLSQNLVYNGSFEQYIYCPDAGGQINRAKYWFSANNGLGGSEEYYNACDNPGMCGVPKNYLGGYQFARTGNAYAGTSFFQSINEGREYIEGTLKNPLTIGKEYCVSLYVCLAGHSNGGIDALGMYFSSDSLITYSPMVYYVKPQISNDSLIIILDSSNWVNISGTFISMGVESFFTLGNFKRNNQTNITYFPPYTDGIAYYLIDDVAIWPCDAPIYSANAGGNKTICKGQSITLGTHQLDEYEYRWLTIDSTLIDTTGFLTVSPDTTTTYVLWVLDFKYDVTWDTVTVFIDEICDTSHAGNVSYLPNVFTPNNDGANDVFRMRGENINQIDMKVYNRWGNLVFETQDINEGWDGKYKSKECEAGVYFYIANVTYKDGSGTLKKGNVTLIR
jgi:gliding motility-associated-like protein